MKPVSLRTRLALLYTTILFICLAGIVLLTYKFFADRLNAALDDELVELATGLRGYLSFSGGVVSLDYDETDQEEAFFVSNATRFYQIYSVSTGNLLDQSPDLELLGLRYTPAELQGVIDGPTLHEVGTDQGTLRFINNLITSDGETYLLELGATTRTVDDSLREFLRLLSWIVPFTLLVSAAAVWWAAGQALKPLAAMAAAAGNINVKDLGYRLPLRSSGDELDHFAQSFNRTLERLEHSIGEMRQFTASIAHELRTPITALRGEAELALMKAGTEQDYRQILASQLEEFEKLTRTINELLMLARAESGDIEMKKESVNLGKLVGAVVEDMELIAAAKDIRIETECATDITVSGDPGWIERLVLNLLDNAIKFTPSGGGVFVGVEGNHQARLTIRDTGSGISAAALPHIFERFFQEDAARSGGGAGLGLSLADWIVDQHKGSIQVVSNPGQGSSFQVVLPLEH